MEKQKNSVKTKLTAIAWCIPVILLCATPCGAQFVAVGETADIDYAIEDDFLLVLGTANLYPGAYVGWGIKVANGGTVNLYGGEIGDIFDVDVDLYTGEPIPVVTVYGTDFALDDVPLDPLAEQFVTDSSGKGVLTGFYGNGDPIDLAFQSEVPIYLRPPLSPDTEIAIDIKPGSDQNTINLKSKGVVPVAILSTDDFDATSIPADTIFLAGSGVAKRGKGNKFLASEEDVDGDGLLDLVVKVETENIEPGTFQDGWACLKVHESSDQTSTVLYEGWDEINIVPPE